MTPTRPTPTVRISYAVRGHRWRSRESALRRLAQCIASRLDWDQHLRLQRGELRVVLELTGPGLGRPSEAAAVTLVDLVAAPWSPVHASELSLPAEWARVAPALHARAAQWGLRVTLPQPWNPPILGGTRL